MFDIPARFITESAYDSVIESDKTVENVQPDEELYEECDMFIELGNEMFYVSEYHNALFDDPDAHDEVINEFGVLLDSYDDDLIEETFKPYDEYLKKHGYDPKTNSISGRTYYEKDPYELFSRLCGSKSDTIDDPWDPRLDDPNYDGPVSKIDISEFLKKGEQHDWKYLDGTPMLGAKKVKRINVGRIGSKKERNRMNKFLRENGYDPKTETILTDIDDKDHPGTKKRVKFGINSAIGNPTGKMSLPHAYGRVDKIADLSDDRDKGIAMSKSLMQRKPGQSNYVLKHEEGHMAYEDAFDKKRYGTWNANPSHHSPKAFRDDITDARRHIKKQSEKNPALKGNPHDILPTEYQADKYGEEHNRYGRGHGASALKYIESKVKQLDPATYRAHRDVMIRAYGTGETGFKKYIKDLQDQYDELRSDCDSFDKDTATLIKKQLVGIKREIDAGFPESRKVFFSLTQSDEKKAIDEALQRDADKISAGTNSRAAFMKKYSDKAQSKKSAEEVKRRQLSKEQLQQQLDSGKLSKEQAAKASKKIARIKQFEERQGKATQPPKKSGGKNSAKKK